MDRKRTTEFLSNLLISNRLSGRGKYYAKEVSLDYGTANVRRIDFLQFEPQGVVDQSDIILYMKREKKYDKSRIIKKCKADFIQYGDGKSDIEWQKDGYKASGKIP